VIAGCGKNCEITAKTKKEQRTKTCPTRTRTEWKSNQFANLQLDILKNKSSFGWSVFCSITEKEQRKNKETFNKFNTLKKQK
jgi:hypothetical protein